MSQARKLVIVESPAKARTIAGLPRRRLRRRGQRRAHPRPAAARGAARGDEEGPVRQVRRRRRQRLRRLLRRRRRQEEEGQRAQEGAQGRRRALPRDGRGPRGRGHRLAPAPGAQAQGPGQADGVPRDHPRGDPARAGRTPATSTTGLVDAQETRRILDRLYGYEVSPGAVAQGPPGPVRRPRAVRRHPARRRARARADGVPRRRLLGRHRHVRRRRRRRPSQRLQRPADLGRRAPGRHRPRLRRPRQLHGPQNVAAPRRGAARPPWSPGWTAPTFTVALAEKPYTRRPAAPFTTSTLQQEAGRKLRLSSRQTMRVAQSLYENGYITYMRTDSTSLSARRRSPPPAGRPPTSTARSTCRTRPALYASKAKNAQEAHEAIRPAGDSFRTPAQVAGELRGDEFRLYELIWKRTVASQMADARGLDRDRPARRATRGRRPRRRVLRVGHGDHLPRLPRRLRGGPRRAREARRGARRGEGRRAAADDGRGRRAGRVRPRRRRPRARPRRRATPRPAWSRRWRSAASAARRRTPRRSRRSRTAAT